MGKSNIPDLRSGFFKNHFQAVVIPILLGLLAWSEIKQSLPCFRLFSLFLLFLLLADIALLLRGRWRDALLILTSAAFGACVIEATAGLAEQKQSIVVTEGWSVSRPIIGWGPEHPGRFHAVRTDPKTGAIIYDADYTIDSNLLRLTVSNEKGPTVVFFGDSFTFGFGVNDDDTMPQAFANALGRRQRVLNLGNGGYGPQQFLRELETGLFDQVIGSQPKLFIFTTAAWHAERTACKHPWVWRAPRYALEDGRLTFKGPCYEGASLKLREWLQKSASYRLIADHFRNRISHDDVELYIRILLAAVDLAKEKYGVPTLVPYMRAPDNYLPGAGFSDDAIIERLRQGGAVVVDVSLQKEEANGASISIAGDGHPTPLAHRLRASILKTYIEQNMSGVLVSGLE